MAIIAQTEQSQDNKFSKFSGLPSYMRWQVTGRQGLCGGASLVTYTGPGFSGPVGEKGWRVLSRGGRGGCQDWSFRLSPASASMCVISGREM